MGKTKVYGNVCDGPEQHWRVYKNEDFFDNFPKLNLSEWSYNIGVYGNIFCLDKKSTRSPSFMVRQVVDQMLQMWKKIHWIFVHLVLGPRIRRESRVLAPELG